MKKDQQPPNPARRLKEAVVKDALKSFAWEKLKKHLLTLDIDAEVVSELLLHIRHSTDFLLKRPDQSREDARAAFTDALGKYVTENVGAEAAAELARLI